MTHDREQTTTYLFEEVTYFLNGVNLIAKIKGCCTAQELCILREEVIAHIRQETLAAHARRKADEGTRLFLSAYCIDIADIYFELTIPEKGRESLFDEFLRLSTSEPYTSATGVLAEVERTQPLQNVDLEVADALVTQEPVKDVDVEDVVALPTEEPAQNVDVDVSASPDALVTQEPVKDAGVEVVAASGTLVTKEGEIPTQDDDPEFTMLPNDPVAENKAKPMFQQGDDFNEEAVAPPGVNLGSLWRAESRSGLNLRSAFKTVGFEEGLFIN